MTWLPLAPRSVGRSVGEDFVRSAFETAYREQADMLGRFNLAIFGTTGAGKSTLINAISCACSRRISAQSSIVITQSIVVGWPTFRRALLA